jgi:hypothetical protein
MKRLLDEHLRAWRETLATLAFFALMAIFVPAAKRAHLGTGGMFFAMIGSAALVAAVYYGRKLLRRRMAENPISGQELVSYYTGGTLAKGEEDLGGSALVAMDPITMQEVGVTRKLSEYDEATLALVKEAEASLQNEDLPDRIIEENPVYLSETFQPDVTSLIGAMILLIGMRRSGKSNATAVFIEELARWLLPIVVFDTQDEHRGLVDKRFLPRGVHAGSMDLLKEQSELRNFVPIDEEGAYEFGRSIMEGRLQVVVNLESFPNDIAAKIMSEMIAGINDWEQARRNRDRLPVMVVLEEAPKWLPQNLADSVVSRDAQALLHDAFFGKVVARGGKNGFGLIATAQRYSTINKNLLQPLWQFLFFQKAENDVDRYMKLGLPRGATMSLQQSECFVFGPTVLGFRTKIRERYSEHMGHTPGIDALLAHRASMMPVPDVLSRSFARGDEHSGPGTIYRYQGMVEQIGIPYRQGNQRYPQTSAQKAEPAHSDTTMALSPQLQLALDLYNQGANTIFRLASAMTDDGRFGTISSEQASEMIAQLKTMGWIEQETPTRSRQQPTQLERAVEAYQEGHTSIDRLASAIDVTTHVARRLMSEMKVKKLV